MTSTSQAEFVAESREHLQIFEQSMLELETATDLSGIRACIHRCLREVHSLKGNAGFLGYHAIQKLAHACESFLESCRDTPTGPSPQAIETALVARDRLSAMVEDVAHSNSYPIADILERLHGLESSFQRKNETLFRIPLTLSLPMGINLIPALATLANSGTISEPSMKLLDMEEPWTKDSSATAIYFRGFLSTSQSPIEIQRRLAEQGLDVNWANLGCVDVVDHFHDGGDGLNWISQQSGKGKLIYHPRNLVHGIPNRVVWMQETTNEKTSLEEPPKSIIGDVPQEIDAPTSPSETLSEYVPSSPAIDPEPIVSESSSTQVEALRPAPVTPTERSASLRIQVDLLDRLMNLVGELTLVRNQSLLAFEEVDGGPRAILQRLNTVTSELQDAVLKTRMQPVGNLFGRFPRMVRDLSRQLGKQVELITVGQEVELDKTVLEQLTDPLTHLIRNSIDHGLERPEERVLAGKSPMGRVTLSATASDGQVIIEIRDDGRGINPEAVRAKVLALGLKSQAELQKISTKELYSYILLPGFSTAKQVSDVSGRGVGMDVVKTNVESLEGNLSIESSPGVGTTMVVRVPLTLAILPCLMVTVGAERFAVPQRGLEEIVCLHPGGRGTIESSYDTEFYRLRETLLPVVRFSEILKRPKPFDSAVKSEILAHHSAVPRDPNRIEYILVLRTGGRRFGLLVDDVRGTEEVVVKPMHPSLKRIGIFSGATLMGDGRVALITNIDGISEHAGCYGIEQRSSTLSNRDPAEVHRVLLFEYGPNEQFAVPLVQIRRIETISMDRVAQVGDQKFITIDGISTRIVQLDQVLDVSSCQHSSQMYLLLPKFVQEPMGILVSRIVDTESLSIELQRATVDDPGLLGTAIVRGRLSLFVDTQYLREKFFGRKSPTRPTARQQRPTSSDSDPSANPSDVGNMLPASPLLSPVHRILLVDDTPFFREVVRRYFEREGLLVETAVDGLEAMQLLKQENFDLVVSDIEMPNMDGWQFCQAARRAGFSMPFLALTSLSKAEYQAKAADCGFDDFEEKLDHDQLVASVYRLLHQPGKEAIR